MAVPFDVPAEFSTILKSKRIAGLLFVLLSSVSGAVFDIITRFYSTGLTPYQMLMMRAVFGIAMTVVIAKATRLDLLGKNRGGMVLAALSLVGGVICFTVALLHLPVFEALLLVYTYPAFGALLSPLLAGDRSGIKVWVLIGVAFCGTGFILWPQGTESSLHWGHLLGLLAGLGHGLAFTLIRRYGKDGSALTPFFYFCMAGGCVSLVVMSFRPEPFFPGVGTIPVLFGIAVTATCYQLFVCKALTYLPSSEVGIGGMSEIAFGALLSFALFGEAVGLRQIGGALLVLASGVVLAVDAAREAPSAKLAVAGLPGESPGQKPGF